MLRVAFHAHVDVALAPERRNVVDGKRHYAGDVVVARWTHFERYFPNGEPFGDLLGKHFGIGGGGDSLWREKSALLMMPVAAVNAAPSVDDDLRAECANHAHHVFERNAAPDFSGLLGGFHVSRIHGTGEELAHAVMFVGGEKFFGANNAQLGSLFGADGVLSALAAGDGQKRDVGIEAARKIREQAGPFVVGVSGDEKDARRDAGFVYGFDGFGEGLGGDRWSENNGGDCGGQHLDDSAAGFGAVRRSFRG